MNSLELSETANSLVSGTIFEHYKGHHYKLLYVAIHTETLEELVVYQALYGNRGIWVRPLKMFLELVNVHGSLFPRFKQISSPK